MRLTLEYEQQGLKLIKIMGEFVVVDLKATIEINDYFYPLGLSYPKKCVNKGKNSRSEWVEDYLGNQDQLKFSFKIIFASSNLNLEGVPVIEMNDEYSELRKIGLTSDQCCEVIDYYKSIGKIYNEEQMKLALLRGYKIGKNDGSDVDRKKDETFLIDYLKQPKVDVIFENDKPVKCKLI